MTRSCEQLEIDTKGICLLCLGSRIGPNCFESPPRPSLQGLKHLLRYLKVSPKQLFNCSSEFLQSMEIREDIDLKISLCSKCSSVTEKFNKLYQDYELIQLQFGDCVQSLHESMSKGNENPERVRKYKDQMRPTKSSDLVNASIAANLRNETLKKCSLKLESGTPRVKVAIEKVMSNACDVGGSNSNVLEPEHLSISGRGTNATKSQHDVTTSHYANEPVDNDACINVENCQLNDVSDDINVESQVKPVKTNMTRKNHFSALKKKLKTKAQTTALLNKKKKANVDHESLTAIAATATSTVQSSNLDNIANDSATIKVCEYCKKQCSSQTMLNNHMFTEHSEHLISKFLPSHISLELCKEGIHAVWKQMYQATGNQCQFCKRILCHNLNLQRHVLGNHAKQFAGKVLKNIQTHSEITQKVVSSHKTKASKSCVKTRFGCEYCSCSFVSRISLINHRRQMHSEHIVHKFFPPGISLDSCKRGVEAVFEQIDETSESGYQCKFCTRVIGRKADLKLHVLSRHTEHIALEAQQCLGLTEHLEAVAPDALAFSSIWRNGENEIINNSSEDIFSESKQSERLVEMDLETEEEQLIKLEHAPPENFDLDPLDVDYLQ